MDNVSGLAPHDCRLRRQTITWTNAGLLLIGPWWTNVSQNLDRNAKILIEENGFENVGNKCSPFQFREKELNIQNIPTTFSHEEWFHLPVTCRRRDMIENASIFFVSSKQFNPQKYADIIISVMISIIHFPVYEPDDTMNALNSWHFASDIWTHFFMINFIFSLRSHWSLFLSFQLTNSRTDLTMESHGRTIGD